MPFERYLRADDHAINNNSNLSYYYQDCRRAGDDHAKCHYTHGQHSYSQEATHYDYHTPHPHALQFQIPQFMLNGPPILAPGGGAEVLPAGLLDSASDSFASSWFANNGFAPFHSSLISRQTASGTTPPDSASTPSYHPNGSRPLPSSVPSHFTVGVDPRKQPLQEPSPPLEVTTNCIPDHASPQSAGTSNPTSYPPSNVRASDPTSSFPVTTPSGLGLPVYSASGFDVLSILSRVVNRPNPTIQLGPVDLSCSFVIVDVRRYDSPIVYASPTFCHLTGYSEQEALGRNCRFLQSPTGSVTKGAQRRFASQEAVSYMRKLLSSSKECQTTLINYRKGGQAFINLVTVIPLRGGVHNTPEEVDEVVYHIGFQVDLTEQPTRILDKLRDGSYYSINGSWGTGGISSNSGLPGMSHGLGQLAQAQNMTNIGLKGGRHGQMMSIAVSKELRNLIADTTFTDSVSISTGTNMSGSNGTPGGSADQRVTTSLTMLVAPPSSSASMNRMSASGNTMARSTPMSLSPSLSLLLLEFLPDFLLVLSLKGAFLYVAPSVRLVLGYEPHELVGRGISDVCHPADLVPLMRELKEGSVSGLNVSGTGDVGSSTGTPSNLLPKSVDLLFRALPKTSSFLRQRETQSTSAEQGDRYPLQSSTASVSASQSPSSSATLCSNDPLDGTAPPCVWLECRGRLHVEPGKGRKAIILSGRARWMPVVRRGSVGGVWYQGDNAHSASRMTAGSKLSEMSSGGPTASLSMDPTEFWALLSSQGTFLVASASVRDVLGWGTSEMIGRSICAMVRDSQGGMREHVQAELAKLDTLDMRNMVDSPPLVVTTSLVHRDLQIVPMRLTFYRTPRSDKHAPSSTSSIDAASTPLIHPLNNPLCPIVCQATVLSDTEHKSNKNNDVSFGPDPGRTPSQVQIQIDAEDDTDDGSSTHPSGASLFEELATVRGSSWQYELQQLKFTNQRLHEELHALEGARAKSGTESPSSTTGPIPIGQPCPSSATSAAVPILPQPQLVQAPLHYMPLMHSTLSTSVSPLHPPNGLHEQDPPTSDWSSLTGANGQGPNPLKRLWRSEDGPTT